MHAQEHTCVSIGTGTYVRAETRTQAHPTALTHTQARTDTWTHTHARQVLCKWGVAGAGQELQEAITNVL